MKHVYSKVPLILAFVVLIFYLPTQSYSQCLCTDGSTPQVLTVQQTRIIRPIDDSTNFDLPQFDPSLGQLVCAKVFANITSVIRMRLENDEIYPLSYRISYTRSDVVTGPGLTPPLTNNFTKNYGPYNLDASDGNPFSGPDYVFIGPDSVLKNKNINRTVTNLVPFLGYGTVPYFYKVTGKTTVSGGINYIFSVSSQDFVTVGINYNFCPNILLDITMKDFIAVLKERDEVQLSWTTLNETKGNQYEVELSSNGTDFQAVGTIESSILSGSTSTKYAFPYHMNQGKNAKTYFKIKQTTSAGKVTYSPVRQITTSAVQANNVAVYPNPARSKVQLQFEQVLQGNYSIDLVNMNGQVVFHKLVRLEKTPIIDLDLGTSPPAGVYHLRAKELTSNKTYSSKLIISQ